jgi:hypothetical protein
MLKVQSGIKKKVPADKKDNEIVRFTMQRFAICLKIFGLSLFDIKKLYNEAAKIEN